MPILSILALFILGALLLTIFVGRVSELTMIKIQQRKHNKTPEHRFETKPVNTTP